MCLRPSVWPGHWSSLITQWPRHHHHTDRGHYRCRDKTTTSSTQHSLGQVLNWSAGSLVIIWDSGSVKKPCISMSPINHLYYGSAEYQKTHQIARYMWPGNMPGGMWYQQSEGRCDEGGMVLAASGMGVACWPSFLALIGHTSGDSGRWLARDSPPMRAEKQWHWPWPGYLGWWGTQWGLLTCYAIYHNYNTTTQIRAYRKIILKKPQEQQVCLFQVKKHLTFWLEDQATLSVFIANQCMIGGHFCWFYDRR